MVQWPCLKKPANCIFVLKIQYSTPCMSRWCIPQIILSLRSSRPLTIWGWECVLTVRSTLFGMLSEWILLHYSCCCLLELGSMINMRLGLFHVSLVGVCGTFDWLNDYWMDYNAWDWVDGAATLFFVIDILLLRRFFPMIFSWWWSQIFLPYMVRGWHACPDWTFDIRDELSRHSGFGWGLIGLPYPHLGQ